MSSENVDELYGVQMSESEVDDLLTAEGVGLLSLASENVAYAIPISFGYDGDDRLYFFLIEFGEHSRKLEYIERTAEASFVVYTVESPTRWKSVVVSGEVGQVSPGDEAAMEDAMYDNALAARLFPYANPITGITRAELRIDGVSGRRGMGYDQ